MTTKPLAPWSSPMIATRAWGQKLIADKVSTAGRNTTVCASTICQARLHKLAVVHRLERGATVGPWQGKPLPAADPSTEAQGDQPV